MALQSVNPATGEVIERFSEHTPVEADAIAREAHAAFLSWRERPIRTRALRLSEAAKVLRANIGRYAKTMTLEMGKPIRQSEAEIEKCAWVCDYYAENAEHALRADLIASDASNSYVRFDPLGVVLAVMPWNFPYWQVFRFAAPALAAGNAGLLKHASNVQRCALEIEEVFREAGFPENIFRTLLIGSGAVGDMIRHPVVRAVTLTGSEAAGRAVAGEAGRALKKTVLELGGSDPFIVLRDANLPNAAITAATARLVNSGQSCIAAKRFIVEETIADRFESLFVESMKKKTVGNPLDPLVDVGPLAREDLLAELEGQVRRSIEAGATLLLGGARLDLPGYYFAPTALGNVRPGMPAHDEEVFGPVAAIIRVKDADAAIAAANDSPFGLGSSLWTQNLRQAEELAGRIECGCVFINGMVKSDPRLPFGGVKNSGYGRELSRYGIREFVNIKTVWMQ